MVKISVIIPAYNAEKYIEKALHSIINQSFKEIEIICVDDGSTDNTYDICKNIALDDNRIIVIRQNNCGVSCARNTGLKVAKGKYIVFCDSDDYYISLALQLMYDAIERNDVDVVFFNNFYDYGGYLLKRKPRLSNGIYASEELFSILVDDGSLTGILFTSACNAIYSRYVIECKNLCFHEDVFIGEDGLFNIDYIRHCSRVMYEGDIYLYCYRQYKNFDNFDIQQLIDRFIVTNGYIVNMDFVENIYEQLKYRKLTVSFQVSLYLVQSSSFGVSIKILKLLWNDFSLREFHTFIDCRKINKYKLVLALLICSKQYMLFYMLIRYIYPIFKDKLKR